MANVLLGIHCVVPGCTSTLRKVNQWKARPCPKPKHKGKTQSQCMCPEPYQFFKFPTEVKLQKLWLERVKRPDLEINNLTRVCSLHFVEGKPTRRNYFPNVNLRSSMAEDADNEEDVEEDQQKPAIVQQQQQPSSSKLSQRSEKVSIVPMESLQEEDEDDGYEGDLTISRFSYRRARNEESPVQGNAYEAMPSNTVTITRVKTANTKVVGSISNNMRVDNRLVVQPEKRKVVAPPQRFSNQKPAQQGPSKIRRIVEKTEEYECPYEIDMVEDEGESFETEDSHESKTFIPKIKKVVSERYMGTPEAQTPKVISSQASSQNRNEPVVLTRNIVKPKMIPILAVAPKTQHQVIQPLTVLTQQQASPNQNSSSLARKVTSVQLQIQHSGSISNPTSTIVNNGTHVLSYASSGNVVLPQSSANTNIIANSSNISNPTPMLATPTPAPLATYDPSKQQLQIANPVKYIQECHTRIANLAAENAKLKDRNTKLEAEVQELQKNNNELRREVAQQQAIMRRSPQVTTSAIHVVPKQEPSINAAPPTTTTMAANKSRIRYVIRRPMK